MSTQDKLPNNLQVILKDPRFVKATANYKMAVTKDKIEIITDICINPREVDLWKKIHEEFEDEDEFSDPTKYFKFVIFANGYFRKNLWNMHNGECFNMIKSLSHKGEEYFLNKVQIVNETIEKLRKTILTRVF